MAQCPICHASVGDDFGLVECESCGAQLIVHVDGHVEYSNPDGSHEDDLVAAGEESPRGQDTPLEDSYKPEALETARPDEGLVFFGTAAFDSEATSTETDVAAVIESSAEPQEVGGLSETPETPEALPEEPLAPIYVSNPPDSPDLSDVANFGNSEASGGRDGSLRYNVFVSGIDTSDVRDEFREVITDRKFMWDVEQIIRSIRHGEVRLTGVTPAKAYILISRLRHLPVDIRWEQYAVHQA
ncbi:MAG: hypothetical protein AB7G93_12355 [Bdellovibrionales bacterium]